jgi:hypothetical protein
LADQAATAEQFAQEELGDLSAQELKIPVIAGMA